MNQKIEKSSETTLFNSMETNPGEDKKDERHKQFMNIGGEGDMKRRQYDSHEELRKEKRYFNH